MKKLNLLLLLILTISITNSYSQDKKKKMIKDTIVPAKTNFISPLLQPYEDLVFIDDEDTGGGGTTTTSSNYMWAGSNSSSGIIYRTGIVGIGLTNPPTDTKLYVKADNLKVGIVSEVSHYSDYQFGILSAINRANTKAFGVVLKENGVYSDKFVVMGNGNVRATEVRVKTNIFPDYVFEKDYDLMPLNKVEEFIKKNRHLPNVPKAEKIIKDGLNLGDIQVKQMEKIEELFLHIIKLEKRVKSLENRLKEEKK